MNEIKRAMLGDKEAQSKSRIVARKCVGEGLGTCKRCCENGIWNRMWMCFLYEIEGLDGCYCYECVEELKMEQPPADFN